MKQTPELDTVQGRMQPGELTLHGFLGTDHRKLADILEADDRAVRNLKLTHRQIADRLDQLAEKGQDLMERPVTVEDRYEVCVRDDRGVLPSPWGDGRFNKADVHLHDRESGRELRWNALTAHLIRAHGFYGGRGSDYRIDPAAAAEVLKLQPAGDEAARPGDQDSEGSAGGE
jgi:hypothetical protein